MTTKRNYLFSLSLYKPLLCYSFYFAETLLAYATMPLCLEVLILMLSQSLPLFLILILLFVGGSLDYHWTKLITYYMYFLTNTCMYY